MIKKAILYLIGIIIIFGMKYSYSKAGINDLKWILTPTARWVSILSGIPFEYEPYIGYVNHDFHFIIASTCSGVQFMIIITATLVFSFIHRMKTWGRGFGWLAFSIGTAYPFTVFINGIRIVISIYLPLYLNQQQFYSGWMTPERLHTMIGITVYFTSLLIIYFTAAEHFDHAADDNSQMIPKYSLPLFWYVFISLGIPLLNSAHRNNSENFNEYAILITVTSTTVIFLFYLASALRKHL